MNIEKRRSLALWSLGVFTLGALVGHFASPTSVALAQTPNRVFELRTYAAHPGRLDELNRRFAEQTVQLFERHGMTNVGYFTPQDAPLAENTLVYILAHASRESADASWKAFRADPEWQRISAETQREGPLVDKIESVFLAPTGYSPLK